MFGLRKVHGVEWSGERVKSGAKQLLYEKRSPEQLILHHADMNNLKEIIPSGSVGVVQGIGLAVFPYDDTREIRESLAREIVRILEPGGVALLATKGYNLKAVFEAHGRLFRDGSYTIFQKEEKDAITSPAAPQPPALPVQRIEITMPSDGLPEEITFTSALKGLEDASWQEFGAKAGEAFTVASAYERNGQSLILYADDILQNAMVVDLEHAVKNILAKHNVLGGGKILFYARNDVNATILDRMVKRADPSIETIRILQKDLQTNGDELKETEALLRAARSKGAKELLGIIRGPSQKPEELAALAKGASVPIVIVGPEKGVYSFTQAIAMAMDAKLHNGATNGWLIMLPPVRALTDDIIRQYNEYQASLQALQAA